MIRTGGLLGAIAALLVVIQSVALLVGGPIALFGGRGPIRDAVSGPAILLGVILDVPGRLFLGIAFLLVAFGLEYQAGLRKGPYRAPSYWMTVTGGLCGVLLILWAIGTIQWRFVFAARLVEPLASLARGQSVPSGFLETYGSTIELVLRAWMVTTVTLLTAALAGSLFFTLAQQEAVCRTRWPWSWPMFAGSNVVATYFAIAGFMGWPGAIQGSELAWVTMKVTLVPLAAIVAYAFIFLSMLGLMRARLRMRLVPLAPTPSGERPAEGPVATPEAVVKDS